jgi:hypothetical protein
MCVKIPKGTKYFLSGMKLRGGFSAFTDDSKHSEIIDKTQGEIILEPMTLVKRKTNGTI